MQLCVFEFGYIWAPKRGDSRPACRSTSLQETSEIIGTATSTGDSLSSLGFIDLKPARARLQTECFVCSTFSLFVYICLPSGIQQWITFSGQPAQNLEFASTITSTIGLMRLPIHLKCNISNLLHFFPAYWVAILLY